MPKQRKPPHKMTTDEALRRLFHPAVVKHLRKVAAEHSPRPVRKSKAPIKRKRT